jgi:hypothetical protein
MPEQIGCSTCFRGPGKSLNKLPIQPRPAKAWHPKLREKIELELPLARP